MQETYTKEEFWKKLDDLGEEEVRIKLITKVYGDVGDKKALVEEWLRRKERQRAEAAEKANHDLGIESLKISRSAKNAAWVAAAVALVAAIFSALAYVGSK